MRVAIFTESFLPYLSGVTVSVDVLARALVARGGQVLVAAPAPSGEVPPMPAPPAPAYAWLPSYRVGHFAPPSYRTPWPLPSSALDAVDRFAPDVVHAHSPFASGLLARRAARRSGAPLVFTHHTRFSDYRHYAGPMAPLAGRLLARYLRRFWSWCDAVIAPSPGLAAEIRDQLGESSLAGAAGRSQPRPIVRAIPTGVDVEAFAGVQPADPRPDHGWAGDAVVGVSLGRLAVEKNVGLLLDAMAVAATRLPSLRLLLVGSGPDLAALRRRAERPDLAGRVAFDGLLPRRAAAARLRASDLFVFASRTETQGLVLAEAAASALPIVALDGPGVRDTVRDGVDGTVVASVPGERDEDRLGEAIAALAGDPARRARYAASAVEGAARFSLDACVGAVAQLYDELLRSRA